MRYIYDLTIPANTLASAPAEEEVGLVVGTIKKVEVSFKPGCAWMVNAIILDRNLQISPANSEMYHYADDYTEIFTMDYRLEDVPANVILRGWSPDTVYPHTITFRFDMVPKDMEERDVLLLAASGGFKPGG